MQIGRDSTPRPSAAAQPPAFLSPDATFVAA
jgi:hypothetical protein